MRNPEKAAASQQAILCATEGAPKKAKIKASRAYPAQWTDREKKRRQETFSSAAARDEKLAAVKEKGDTWTNKRHEKFEDAAGLYSALLPRSSRRESVKAAYRQLLDTHITPVFRGRYLQSIDRVELYLFKCRLAMSNGLELANRVMTVVRQVFRIAHAKGREWIKTNPAVGLPALRGWVSKTIIRELQARARLNLLTVDQIRLLLASGTGALGVAIGIALRAGLRIGEIVALQWEDITFADFEKKRGYITIRFASDKKGNRDQPKAQASNRTVPFGPTLFDILLKARPDDWTEQDFVVSDGEGRPIRSGAVASRFRRLQPRIGIGSFKTIKGSTGAVWQLAEDVFGFHMLRHACAALWIWRDVPVKIMARWLGHADEKTSLNIYGYLFRYRRNGAAKWPLPAQRESLAA